RFRPVPDGRTGGRGHPARDAEPARRTSPGDAGAATVGLSTPAPAMRDPRARRDFAFQLRHARLARRSVGQGGARPADRFAFVHERCFVRLEATRRGSCALITITTIGAGELRGLTSHNSRVRLFPELDTPV